MTDLHRAHRHLDVACDLDGAETVKRLAKWRSLREHSGLGAEPIFGGGRLWLRADAAPVIYDLAEQEAQCCGFLDFEVTSEGDRVRVDVTSPVPEGSQVAAFLVGLGP